MNNDQYDELRGAIARGWCHPTTSDIEMDVRLVDAIAQEVAAWQAALSASEGAAPVAGWRHIANEWADMATNGTQWLRNVRDGISTTAEALAEMESNCARIRALQLPAATPQPAVKERDEARNACIELAHKVSALEARAAVNGAGLSDAQEPKYTVNGFAIVNRASGEPIPAEEPVFIFRARDIHAREALESYACVLAPGEHRDAVVRRVADFVGFAHAHSDRMKEPDTAAAAPDAQARPVAKDWPEAWQRSGFNRCVETAVQALHFLAHNERPRGGGERYNAEHLLQTADELRATLERISAPTAPPAEAVAQCFGTVKPPAIRWICKEGAEPEPGSLLYTRPAAPLSESTEAVTGLRIDNRPLVELVRLSPDGVLTIDAKAIAAIAATSAGEGQV